MRLKIGGVECRLKGTWKATGYSEGTPTQVSSDSCNDGNRQRNAN